MVPARTRGCVAHLKLASRNIQRRWVGQVSVASSSKANLLNPLLEALDRGGEVAQTVLVSLATLQAGERHDTVVDDEADVGGVGGVALGLGGAREDLANHVTTEGCELVNLVDVVFGDVGGGEGTTGSEGGEVHCRVD
jgi:hypothetical protein